jgi:hypothetical protein
MANELLPEDLAQVLTPAQAYDRVKQASVAYINATSKGSVPPAVGLEMRDSRQALAQAMKRDKAVQGDMQYDSYAQDLWRNKGKAWDGLKGLAAHVPGFFGDMNEMVPGPLQSPIDLPTSREIGEKMGADVDNPGFTIAGLASPMPNELKGLLKIGGPALAAALGYMGVASKAGGVTPALAKFSANAERGGPLLHASPFKFDFFDAANMGKGEGFQAYSPGGFYFSDADLVRGTHKGYLSQFGRHESLGFNISSGDDAYAFVPGNITDMARDTTIAPSIQKNGSDLPIHNAQDQLNWLAEDLTKSLNSNGIEANEAAVQMLLSRLGRHSGMTRVVDNIGLKRSVSLELDAAMERYPQDAAFIQMERDALEGLELSKQQPYSYKIEIPDEIKDNLPIYDVPIKDQPAKYRGAVESLARDMFDEAGTAEQLKEAKDSLQTWEKYLNLHGSKQPPDILSGEFFDWEVAVSFDKNKLQDTVASQRAYVKSLQQKMDTGVDTTRSYGELVRDLQTTHGDEVAQRMLYEAGIPGSRNRTWRTRQQLNTPLNAVKSLFSKSDEVYNYAIWDMDVIDEVVRRQTKAGKILEESAETVYRRGPKAVRAGAESALPEGHLRFRHFGNRGDIDTLQVDKFGTGIRGEERARGAMPTISAYPDSGFIRESGLGVNEFVIDVPKSQMYDINADPMNLKAKAQVDSGSFRMVDGKMVPTSTRTDMNTLEELVKEEGFFGYYTPDADGNLRGQARFFGDIKVR